MDDYYKIVKDELAEVKRIRISKEIIEETN